MRKMKYVIILLLFFVMIGYAAISVSLSINGNATVASDIEDFKVYFSDVLVNDVQSLNLVKSDNELTFIVTLNEINEVYKIEYDVTNGSKLFDAALTMNCTQGNSYLAITNEFDTSDLTALSTRSGVLTLKKTQTNSLDYDRHYTVTCTIVSTPISRDSVGSGSAVTPLKPFDFEVGDIININGEKFNVISFTDDTVTMLAQYNLGIDYRQSTVLNAVTFSNTNGWEFEPGPKEIDIQTWSTNPKTYVNEYVTYLKSVTRSNEISGNLITMNELGDLGCEINSEYYYGGGTLAFCTMSEYNGWLINGQYWWTRSALSNYPWGVWHVIANSDSVLITDISYFSVQNMHAIRPTITISKDVARAYYVRTYSVGEEVFIGDEAFNVISDNGDTVTLLAQYNLGTNYKQSQTANSVMFSGNKTWVYSPGPKEIDLQTYCGESKTYVNNYVTYLKGLTGDTSLTGDLITLAQLSDLGCTVSETYSEIGGESCSGSSHVSWINNGQSSWTRSAYPNSNGLVWVLSGQNFSLIAPEGTGAVIVGVRPLITVSKKNL